MLELSIFGGVISIFGILQPSLSQFLASSSHWYKRQGASSRQKLPPHTQHRALFSHSLHPNYLLQSCWLCEQVCIASATRQSRQRVCRANPQPQLGFRHLGGLWARVLRSNDTDCYLPTLWLSLPFPLLAKHVISLHCRAPESAQNRNAALPPLAKFAEPRVPPKVLAQRTSQSSFLHFGGHSLHSRHTWVILGHQHDRRPAFCLWGPGHPNCGKLMLQWIVVWLQTWPRNATTCCPHCFENMWARPDQVLIFGGHEFGPRFSGMPSRKQWHGNAIQMRRSLEELMQGPSIRSVYTFIFLEVAPRTIPLWIVACHSSHNWSIKTCSMYWILHTIIYFMWARKKPVVEVKKP